MKPVTHFDRKTCKLVADDLESHLRAFSQKWGLTVTLGRGKFSPEQLTQSIELTVKSDKPVGREADAFRLNAVFYGLQPTDLGRTVDLGSGPLTITGLRPRAPKKPILLRSPDGKTFVAPATLVARMLKVAA